MASFFNCQKSTENVTFGGMIPGALNGNPYITLHVYNFSNSREVLMQSSQNTLLSFSVFSTTVLSVKINGINFKFLEWYIVSRIALEVFLPLNIKGNLEVIGGNLTNLKYYYIQEKKTQTLKINLTWIVQIFQQWE